MTRTHEPGTLADVSDAVWMIGAGVVLAALCALALWMEPHWASKDGMRFICRAQLVGARASTDPPGRWREVRGHVENDDIVVRARSPLGGSLSGTWSIVSRGEPDRRNRHVYLLQRTDEAGRDEQLALRIPDNSRARPTFDALIPQR